MGIIQQEKIIISNLCAPCSDFINQIELNGKDPVNTDIIIMGDLNTALLQTVAQPTKIHIEILMLSHILEYLDSTGIYRKSHPTTMIDTFSSKAYGSFSEIDHFPVHTACNMKYRRIKVTTFILRSLCNEISNQ